MAIESAPLNWSTSLTASPTSQRSQKLPGDKILLPPSALEQILAASTTVVEDTDRNFTRFDAFNPYALAAARQERSQWRETQQQLPHPLTFRLVNPKNGNEVYAGIREFSAAEGEIELSPFLRAALGLNPDSLERKPIAEPNNGVGDSQNPIDLTNDIPSQNGEHAEVIDLDDPEKIIIHAKVLQKGTYVRLRPLEAGYNPDNWKSILEQSLRKNYTTLTLNETLNIPADRRTGSKEFRFLVDKFAPEVNGICIIDTDLEVDIEALDEEQARETMKQMMSKSQPASSDALGSSTGGNLDIWSTFDGQILEGEYVDFQLPSWDRSAGVEIELTLEENEMLDLFVSPLTARQRSLPRDNEHVFGNFESGVSSKKVRIEASNSDLEIAEAIYISVHGYKGLKDSRKPEVRRFSLRVRSLDKSHARSTLNGLDERMHDSGDEQCKNCNQWIPSRTMMLHTNFCLRNNVLCPHCRKVFQKNSPQWKNHWHCPKDDANGSDAESQTKHNTIFHTEHSCSACEFVASSLPRLAQHRTTVCPGKIILCQFCHLAVPQEGDPFNPSPESLMSGLTEHELADGSRTTNCHLCNAIVRLRDMTTHLKHHDLSRLSKPLPRICRNSLCGRTLDGVGKNGEIGKGAKMGQGPGNDLSLCSLCFGPLYVSMYDPEGKALKRRIERRYISQLIAGCGKAWCQNQYCKLGRQHTGLDPKSTTMTAKEALPVIKPLVEDLPDFEKPIYFCVDEASQKRRQLAEMLAGENGYDLEWCIAALEAETGNLDGAREWLRNWAPNKKEASLH